MMVVPSVTPSSRMFHLKLQRVRPSLQQQFDWFNQQTLNQLALCSNFTDTSSYRLPKNDNTITGHVFI